ncbi:class I SAM-dependent methyltransferase [uncultured Roseobacter sp.]|uniref:class I SAM-dependent methyltransferase n=1 Tax=uncultured Roseobacter sp. TaxID=114847 RepID=UPI0026183F82|nr:class I SAM-dependent methyltransferase [uncultured Roseobacter sp.]
MTTAPITSQKKFAGSGFWNRIANRYAKSPVADQETYERKLKITRSHLKPHMDVMEFGCGTGSTALIHAPFVKHILALDFSEQMIRIAQDKARDQGIENVTFMTNRIEDFDPPAHRYDAVLGMSILHLLPDQRRAIAKTYDMLKPGGYFFSSTACLSGEMSWFRPIIAIGSALRLLPKVAFFTVEELQSMLQDAGFIIETSWKPGPRKGVFIVAKKPR